MLTGWTLIGAGAVLTATSYLIADFFTSAHGEIPPKYVGDLMFLMIMGVGLIFIAIGMGVHAIDEVIKKSTKQKGE